MTREDAYDREIAPLMTRIIELCKQHDIPVVASFQYDEPRDPEGDASLCTTMILPKDASKRLRAAADMIEKGFMAFAITKRPRS